MIGLITPTGARPKQIELCAKFMANQDYEGKVLWIIVDDAIPITTDFISDEFRKDWQIIKIYPKAKWEPGINTQARNIIAAIDVIKYFFVDAVFIIEDDDYYKPYYLKEMVKKLNGHALAGQQYTVYYNVVRHTWMRIGNTQHSSLFQTAFTPEVLPVFEKICRTGKGFIDMNFFRSVDKKRTNLFWEENDLAVGIKGQPGRRGIGIGHKDDLKAMLSDQDLAIFKALIGEDYKYYE